MRINGSIVIARTAGPRAHNGRVNTARGRRQLDTKPHQADLRKAAELGITVAQLEDAMQYADEVRDERW